MNRIMSSGPRILAAFFLLGQVFLPVSKRQTSGEKPPLSAAKEFCASTSGSDRNPGTNPAPSAETLQSVSSFPVGVAVDAGLLKNNRAYRNIVLKEYGSVTPENAAKIECLHPRKDTFDFSGFDEIVDFACKNKKRVHEVALIWHDMSGLEWVKSFRGDSSAWERMFKKHIQTVVGHYKGKVESWDVVNDAITGAMRRLAATGLQVHISELDILASDWKKEPGLVYTDELQKKQSDKYRFVAKTYKESVPPLQRYGITVWGVGDAVTWINPNFGLRDWPLPFDGNYQRKKAYDGFLEGLR